MQLTCPECGESIKAEHINIQELIAVCSSCDAVFKFELPEVKTKRRKVHQPEKLTVNEDSQLHLEYRTNFRLDKDESFFVSLLCSVFFTFVTWIMLTKAEFPPVVAMFGFMALFFYYWMGLIIFNKTHIEMADNSIHVSRQPLPSLVNQTRKISLSGVDSFISEETDVSKKEGYDTPRYNVYAMMMDGSRKVIVSDVIEDYGLYIAQRMNEHLHMDANNIDMTRLEDKALLDDESQYILQESSTGNQNHQSHS